MALQALKTLGRQTEGCDSVFTEEVAVMQHFAYQLFRPWPPCSSSFPLPSLPYLFHLRRGSHSNGCLLRFSFNSLRSLRSLQLRVFAR